MPQILEMRLKLTNLFDSRIIEDEDSEGIIEKGLFIPIEKNALHVTENNEVILYAFVNENTSMSKDGCTHFIKQKTNQAHVEKLANLGYRTPYLGNLRLSRFKVPSIYKKRK